MAKFNLAIICILAKIVACYATISDYPSVSIEYGEIKVQNTGNCTFKNDDLTYETDGLSRIPGLWFGLIEYNCDRVKGFIASVPKCKPCGLFCIQNEYIVGCNQIMVPLIASVILSAIIMTIILVCFKKYLIKASDNLVQWILTMYVLHNDNKKHNRTMTLIKHGSETACPNFKQPVYIKKKGLNKLTKSRSAKLSKINENLHKLRLAKSMDSNEDNYMELFELTDKGIKKASYPIFNKELNKVLLTHNNVTQPIEQASCSKPTAPCLSLSSSSPNIPSALMILTFMTLLLSSLACDSTLFIHANGKVCDNTKCSDISTYTFPLQSGSVICFDDLENNVFKIKIESTKMIYDYSKIYRTSSFKIDVNHHTRCAGVHGCWRESCTEGTMAKEYINITGKPTYQSCRWTQSGCGDSCWHGQRCNYFQYWLESTGPLATVYKEVGSYWEMTMVINYKQSVDHITLNVNNPSIDLVDFGLMNAKKMPIVITSFMSENINVDKFLLEDNGNYYNVKAAEQNMPETDIIGDYQIQLFNKDSIYNVNDIHCVIEECSVKCGPSEPKLSRFRSLNTKESMIVTQFVTPRNSLSVSMNIDIKTTVDIMIGNVEFNNLKIEKASCNLQVVMNYACKGCNKRQYTILQAYKIKHEGIMTFTSNCTFNVNYLSCSKTPYKIYNKNVNEICWIYIERTNQTVYIKTDIHDLSKLDPSLMIVSEDDYKQVALEFISSESFITGLINTFTAYGLIAISLAIISRLLNVYMSSKTITKIDHGEP